MFGYAGKLLYVDLTAKKIWEEELTQEFVDLYYGGYGFGAKILFDRMKPGADPLGPDNILGFVTGPLVASGAFFSGRYMVVHKSPMTNMWNDANSGGYFAPELKRAGYDGIFFLGASEKPVYLYIKDGTYELRDAEKFWGMDAKESWVAFQEETGDPKIRAAVIGQAGERMLHSACIMNDGHRAAGRGGPGAVMGSKKLKAVVVRGTGKIEVFNREALMAANKKIADTIKNPPEDLAGAVHGYQTYGTGFLSAPGAFSGDTPVNNWSGNTFEDFGEERVANISAEAYNDKYMTKKYGCQSCPLRCGAEYKVEEGKWPMATERPEYETMGAFGLNCLNDDVLSIIKANEDCNRYGLDTITVGGTVAWAIECYEEGVLTKEDLDGIEATWGNSDAIVALTRKIVTGEGCGKYLSQGSYGAAQAFGKGFEQLAVAGGIEPAMHDSRCADNIGLARTYQHDPTPGRHVKGGDWGTASDDPDRAEIDANGTAFVTTLDCSGTCCIMGDVTESDALPSMVSAVLGKTVDDAFIYQTGMRIWFLRQAFNIREGQTRKDQFISPRLIGKPAITAGANKGTVVDNEKLGDLFFERIGCDVETGIPKKGTLEAIGGLEDVIAFLYPEG